MQVAGFSKQFAFISRCNLCSLPETEVEREDGVRMRLQQLQLRMEETLSLQPVSIDARTEAALEIGDEILAMMENMAAGGNGRATLQLPLDLCGSYQLARLTGKVTKSKIYGEKALMIARSLGKKHLEETQMKIRATDEQMERIRRAKEILRYN